MRVLFSVNDLKCLNFIHFDGNARIDTHIHIASKKQKKQLPNTYDTRIMWEYFLFTFHSRPDSQVEVI